MTRRLTAVAIATVGPSSKVGRSTPSARDAARAVAGASAGVRTLRPLMQMAVASASTEGGVT